MVSTSQSSRPAVVHLALAILFALAAVWAGINGWRAAQTSGASLRTIVLGLALVGFVSLTLRELRALRGAPGSPSQSGAPPA